MRTKEKLSKKLMASKSWVRNYEKAKKLEDIEHKLDLMYKSRRRKKENEAIYKLSKNSSYFYTYAKRFSKTSNQIGDFVQNDGSIISDLFEKAEMLRKHYESVASIPREEYVVTNPDDFFMTETS